MREIGKSRSAACAQALRPCRHETDGGRNKPSGYAAGHMSRPEQHQAGTYSRPHEAAASGDRSLSHDIEIGRAHVELQSLRHLVCRLLLEKKKNTSELQSLRHIVCRLVLEKKSCVVT